MFELKYSWQCLSGGSKSIWFVKIDNNTNNVGYGISATNDAVYNTGQLSNGTSDVYNADETIFSTITGTTDIAYISKWNSDGTANWITKIDSTQPLYGLGISAVCDAVYGCGQYFMSAGVYSANVIDPADPILFSTLSSTSSTTAYTVKWNNDGQTQWITKIDGVQITQAYGISSTCDAVYSTGYFRITADIYSANFITPSSPIFFSTTTGTGNFTAYVAKWYSNGLAQWMTTVDSALGFVNIGYEVSATDDAVYGAGIYSIDANVYNSDTSLFAILPTFSSATSYIIKWDNNGIAEWATIISCSEVQSISVNCNAVYCTGSITNNANVYSANLIDPNNPDLFQNITSIDGGVYLQMGFRRSGTVGSQN